MQKTSSCTEANNYADFLYILSESTIKPHIDRIYFSCRIESDKPETKLFSILKENNYKCKTDKHAKSKTYRRIRTFKSSLSNVSISILYDRREYFNCRPSLGINIYKPDLKTVDWLDSICNSLGLETTLSQVELALDISPYSYNLKKFFNNHLVLKYNRGESCFYGENEETQYIGNKWKNTKSAIIYARPKDSIEKDLLRVEFRFNRKFLISKEINLDSLEKINNLDLTKLMSFKELNKQKLAKHLHWIWKPALESLPEAKRERHLRVMERFPFPEREADEQLERVVEQLSAVKKSDWVNQHSRFFIDMDEVNEAFFGKLEGLKII
jgi:hypothetical protein